MPLSNDFVHSRIADMSSNILKPVMEELAATPFSFRMQLDKNTDISVQPAPSVCYVYADAIKEEVLFCEPFMETTKAVGVPEMVKRFLSSKPFTGRKLLCTY